MRRVAAAWYRHVSEDATDLPEIWVVDAVGDRIRVTWGSYWCLFVEYRPRPLRSSL